MSGSRSGGLTIDSPSDCVSIIIGKSDRLSPFFRADKIHLRQWGRRDGQDHSVTIDDIFARPPPNATFLSKWISKEANIAFSTICCGTPKTSFAMAIEFHDVDPFNSLIEKIKRSSAIFISCTFTATTCEEIAIEITYPGLHRPNDAGLPDFTFEF